MIFSLSLITAYHLSRWTSTAAGLSPLSKTLSFLLSKSTPNCTLATHRPGVQGMGSQEWPEYQGHQHPYSQPACAAWLKDEVQLSRTLQGTGCRGEDPSSSSARAQASHLLSMGCRYHTVCNLTSSASKSS